MPKFLTNIDLQKNELQNAVLQVISGSDPSSPNTGQVFYDGNTNQIKVYTGSAWESLATAVDNTEHIFDTALKIGRDADNLIDFTTDNKIVFRAAGVDEMELIANVLQPTSSDGIALGTGSLMWSDLFLASGGVVNFNNGDMTLTHSANTLTFAGGTTATEALTTSTIVASGIIKTNDTTAATTTTDGSLQTDGGLSVALDAVIGDDLILISDASVLSLGAGKDVTITHDNSTGGTLASAGNFVVDSTGGTLLLDGNSGVSIAGNAAEVDITTTAALDLNSGAFTLDASTISIDSSDNANITVAGTSKTLDIDASGALTIDSATSIAIGANADKPIDIDSSTLDIDASGALTIDSATSIAIGAAADKPIDIDSSTLDIDASGAITIDSTSTISIDGADDVNLSITSSTAGEDLTIQQIGANDSSILITAAGTGTDAVKIDATAGDMLIAPNLIDGKTLKIGPSGATQIVLTPHGTAGNEKISIINSSGTADDAIKIDAASGGLTLAAGNDSLIIDADGTDADALQLSSAGGIDINATGGAAKDINIDASGSVHIKSTESASDSIKIHSTVGGVKILADAAAAGEDIVIEATGSSVKLKSTESASDAIVLESTLGGIDILASGAAAGEDIDITATGSSVNITSTENAANAVYLHANGGTSETIKIHSDQGTGAASIQLLSDVGGITLTGDTDHGVLVGTVSGAPISIGHSTSETTVNDNLTVTGTLTATGGLTDNSGVLTILDTTASATNTGGKLVLASNDSAAFGDTHRLGVIEFQAAEDDANNMVTGARIEATAEAAWSDTENGTALEFYTSDGDAAQGIALTLDSDQKASFASHVAIAGNLTVAGTTTTENTTIIESTVSVLQFEGASDNDHETILKVVEPTADTTFSLPAIAAGNYFIAALADTATAASAAVTATEFALLDGGSSVGSTAVQAGHGIHMNHGGSMAHTDVDTLDTYLSATTKTLTNKTLTTPVLTSPTVTTSIVPTNANTATLGTADKEWGDLFLGDGGVIKLGSDQDVTLTHVADAGITLNSAMKLHFGDTGTYIHQSADGVLDLVSDNELELNATTVDLNGNLDVSGTALVTGVLTTTAQQISNGGIQLATNKKLEFRDSDLYINSSGDGQLDIVADSEVQIAATTVDLNGNLDVSGTALVTGVLTTTAQQISNGGMQLATNKKLEFRDGAIYINSDADGYLEAVADTGISLKIGSTEQVILEDGVFKPTADSDVDLGTSSVFWKDAFIDKITTTGVIELGHATDTTVARSASGIIKVQSFDVPLVKSFVLDHDVTGVAAAADGDTDSLTFTITHGFPATQLVKVEILTNSGNYDTVFADVTRPTDATVLITFATAVANAAYVALLTRVG